VSTGKATELSANVSTRVVLVASKFNWESVWSSCNEHVYGQAGRLCVRARTRLRLAFLAVFVCYLLRAGRHHKLCPHLYFL
jgi:hypothetical protein